jgi:very-short-patch-repair endonuclease
MSADAAIGRLARAQHGVISLRQLVALGLGRGAVRHRVTRRRLIRVHRGVYAVGHDRLTHEGRLMAAVLAGGPGAVLSHRCAGARFALPVRAPRIEITVPTRRAVPGITLHASTLPADEHEVVDGLPMTTVARTLLDLAGLLSAAELRKAFGEADYLRLTSPVGLPELLLRHPSRPGAARLRAILADHTLSTTCSETELEADFHAFLADHGLPPPHRQYPVMEYRLDCAWPHRRLVIEVDGRATHTTASRFDSDRERDRELTLAGWTVVRVTNRMLRRNPARLAADLRALLQAPARAADTVAP